MTSLAFTSKKTMTGVVPNNVQSWWDHHHPREPACFSCGFSLGAKAWGKAARTIAGSTAVMASRLKAPNATMPTPKINSLSVTRNNSQPATMNCNAATT